MTGESTDLTDSIADAVAEASRRSFMKKGAAASGAAALGIGASGSAAANEGAASTQEIVEGQKGLVFPDNFHPFATFAFVSGVVQWRPNYAEVRDDVWSDYNTRLIRWHNTGNVVPFWVAQEANVGEFDGEFGFVTDVDDDANQPQLFEMDREWTPFGDNPRWITVNFSPVDEDEEDDLLDNDDWWQEGGGGGGGGG